MNGYFISPFVEFKTVFEKCYTEHRYTKQIVLLPCDVKEYLSDPKIRLLGLDDAVVASLQSSGVFDFLIAEGIILNRETTYKEISNFFVRPRFPYLGLPIGNLNELSESFVVFGVPYFLGNPTAHGANAPHAIARNYSQKYNLQVDSLQASKAITGKAFSFAGQPDVFDLGELYINQRESVFDSFQKITDAAERLIHQGNRFIAIGGDHSITYPLFKGVQKHFDDLVCLQIDAHNDLFLLTECHFSDLAPSHSSVIGKLLHEGISVYSIGIRDFVNIDSLGMAACETYECSFTMSDEYFLETLSTLLPKLSSKNVYLTLDVDVIDPRIFSSVTDPLANGIRFETLTAALNLISRGNNVVAMDIVEAALSENNPVDTHNFLNLLIEALNTFYEQPN